jgi:hypothetical protein
MTDWIGAFSMPVPRTSEAAFDTIGSAYGSSIVNWLVDLHGVEIDATSDGVLDVLRGWAKGSSPLATVWDIAFGRAHLALKEGQLDIGEVAARLALRLADAGQVGTWTATVPPTPITLGNTFVEDVTTLSVDIADDRGHTVTLRRADGTGVELRRAGPDDPWVGPGSGQLRSVGVGKPVYLMSRPTLPADAGSKEIFGESLPVASIDGSMEATFQAGFDILREIAPHYLPWIERVLHGVVVCATQEPFHLVSGSWEDVPAFVHISCPHAAIDIADILVHESSHQYFYLLQKVGPLDDGSDDTLYYSPATRTKRPLSRLLMALHAFVNVLDLYEAVRRHETPDLAYVVANEPTLLADIARLDEPLRDNPALTDLGRGLYQPLADRLSVLGR